MEEDGKCCVREVGESRVEWADIQSLISLSPLLAPCELLEPQEDHKQNLRQTSLSPLQTPLFICTKSTREVSCKSSFKVHEVYLPCRLDANEGSWETMGKYGQEGDMYWGQMNMRRYRIGRLRSITMTGPERPRRKPNHSAQGRRQEVGLCSRDESSTAYTQLISGVQSDTHFPERYGSGTSSSSFKPNRNSSASF